MQVTLRNQWLQRLVMVGMVAVFLLVTVRIARVYIASVLSHTLSARNLLRATQLDPSNADYHISLGRFYQYSITDSRPEEAIAQFRRAVELAPKNPDAWLNLAAAMEFDGKTAEAEKYLRHADLLAPRLPKYQWTIGNYFLLHGNAQEAFRHFKAVLAGTRQYDRTVFDTAWKSSGNANEILESLIPDDLPADFSYLDYLVSTQRFSAAQPVWKRIMNSPDKFDPHQAAHYIDNLIQFNQPDQAHQVWVDLQSKGLIRGPSSSADTGLISNGNFEDKLLSMGFGWRIIPVQGVYAGIDTSTFHSPGHALFVQFTGNQNLDYYQVFQLVKVLPNHPYTLRGFMKVQGITTDSGPRLAVRDAYNPSLLNELSDDLTGTSVGWNMVTLNFKTGPKTPLIVIVLARLPSQKLDNSIAGKVWLDDLQLTADSDSQ